jgi:hypothetical protein
MPSSSRYLATVRRDRAPRLCRQQLGVFVGEGFLVFRRRWLFRSAVALSGDTAPDFSPSLCQGRVKKYPAGTPRCTLEIFVLHGPADGGFMDAQPPAMSDSDMAHVARGRAEKFLLKVQQPSRRR